MSFLVPARLFTELDAVNMCLGTKGLEPVDVINSGDVEQASILNALNATDLEVQTGGWSWNTNYLLTLALNSSGHAPLPDQTLVVSAAYWNGRIIAAVQRGQELYDSLNNTLVWTSPPIVDLTFRAAFTDIPQAARNYIAVLAGHRWQAKSQGSPVTTRITSEECLIALAALEQYEDQVSPQNSMGGNLYHQLNIRGAGVRRNRT